MDDLPASKDVLAPGDQYEGCSCLDHILALEPDPLLMTCPRCGEWWEVFGKKIQARIYHDQPQELEDLPSHIAVRITKKVLY